MIPRASVASNFIGGLVALLCGCSSQAPAKPTSYVPVSRCVKNVYQIVVTGSIEERFRADTEMANASAELAGIPISNRTILEAENGPLYATDGFESLPRYVRAGRATKKEIQTVIASVVSAATSNDVLILCLISHGTQIAQGHQPQSALLVFAENDPDTTVTGSDTYSATELSTDLSLCRAPVFFCTGACYGGGLARSVKQTIPRSIVMSACGDSEIACTKLGASFVSRVLAAFHRTDSDINKDGSVDMFEAYRAGFEVDRKHYESQGYRPCFLYSGIDPLRTRFNSTTGWTVTAERYSPTVVKIPSKEMGK